MAGSIYFLQSWFLNFCRAMALEFYDDPNIKDATVLIVPDASIPGDYITHGRWKFTYRPAENAIFVVDDE